VQQVLNTAQTSFESEAPSMPVSTDFDAQKAYTAIETQRKQLARLTSGEPLVFVAAPGLSSDYYVLTAPMTYEAWKGNHAVLSVAGGVENVSAVVQAVSGTAAVVTSWTGVGPAVSGAVCVGATVVKEVSGYIEVGARIPAAITYVTGVYGWLTDMTRLPQSYLTTVDLLESEAANPYYLSKTKTFSGDISVDMNLTWVSVPLPINWNTADVTVTNTSSLSADYLVIAHGWWDFKLPGDWPILGYFFGGETNIRIPTVASAPTRWPLSSGESVTSSMLYMGYFTDPVNLFSPHWLKLDLYAGPFLVDSVSKSYYSYQMPSPLRSSTAAGDVKTGVYATALTKDGPQLLDEPSYGEMLPVITQLADTSLDPTTSLFEVRC